MAGVKRDHPRKPQAMIPFSGDQPPTDLADWPNVYQGDSNPAVPDGYDMNLADGLGDGYPHDSYKTGLTPDEVKLT